MLAEKGDPSALHIEVYRVVSLGCSIPHNIECIATYRALVFVGTTDSKVVVYRVGACNANTAPLTLLQEITDSRKHAVRQLTVVAGRRLLVLASDVIHVYHIHDDTDASGNKFELRPITTITGLKDTIAFHVKQHRGVISMAVLQRKRVAVYEASNTNLDFLLSVTTAVPDGLKTVCWMGRNIILGGRKEYLIYNPSGVYTPAPYRTPRSGATPLALPMAPVPEVLVSIDGAGLRALLYDGSGVPGNSHVLWATPPAEMRYEHPYVVSYHPSEPQKTLQVRLPLLTTLKDDTGYPQTCLYQNIDLPNVRKVAQCHWVDYDCAMPSTNSPPDALLHSPIVVTDADHSLYLLARTSMTDEAEALAAAKLFSAANLLCRLCPHEVLPMTMRQILVAGALHKFIHHQDYLGCFHDLSSVECDPRVAIKLFPGFLRVEEASLKSLELPLKAPATVVVTALPALAEYLESQRAMLLLSNSGLPTESGRLSLKAVDRALVMSLCFMKREEALLELLRGENACEVADVATLLREHQQWVALTVLLEASGQYEEAASQLRHLASTSEAAARVLHSHSGVIKELCALYPFSEARGDAYVPQCTIRDWITSHSCAHPLPASEMTAICTVATAMVTALRFFRRRSLSQSCSLFEEHASWVLGTVPPDSAVGIFLSEANLHYYNAALQVIQVYTENPRTTPRLLLVVEYLYQLFAEPRVQVTEHAVYERYWRGLGALLFVSPASTCTGVKERQRLRDRLDEFLLTSQHLNLESAEAYFDAADIRSRCLPERTAVHRRKGSHREAIAMLLDEAECLGDAIAYARSVCADGSSDAFTALLEALLRPSSGSPRVTEALEVMNTCDGVDAAAVLPMLPDEMPLAQVSTFLLQALRTNTRAYRQSAVYSAMLKAKLRQSEENRLRLASRAVVLEEGMVCPVCQRRLRPDTVLSVYPNNVILHEGCTCNENVCPATLRNYRHDAYASLEDL
ncbi:hypothetical protein, conserved [Leishmania tarentolae]|uniref:CNH domain-containing protein n=1 Tax=Leishmania tarentolae TaxID=5689 RepID=A0A640KB92_LEITA|nr:hypothetical protein, conserved [Leishmania tarentolae]